MTTTYEWRGGNGAFNNAAKWSPRGVPGENDNADFASGGTINGDGGGVFEVATLSVEAKVTFTSVNGSYSPTVDATNGLNVTGKLYLDDGSSLSTGLSGVSSGQPPASASIDSGGFVSVSESQFNVNAGGLNIGSDGNGTLIVTNSGSLLANSGSTDYAGLSLGSDQGGDGVLTVTKDGVVTVMDSGANFGYAGDAKVTVSAGGTIALAGQSGDNAALGLGATSTSKGTLSITGSGSTVSIGDGALNDGFQGAGVITVASEGTLAVTVADIGIVLGVDAGGSGVLTVKDGVLNDAGELQVGNYGTGTFLLEAKGTATLGALVSPSVAPALSVGLQTGGVGKATIEGSGTGLTVDGQIDVGLSGSGKMYVQSGAKVQSGDGSGNSTAGVALGIYNGGTGALTVTGKGSSLGNTGLFVIGSHGSAHVTVSETAEIATTLSSSFGVDGVDIGSGSDAVGTLTLETAAAFGDALNMVVGGRGSGSVSVATGASLSIGNSLTLSSSPVALVIGQSSGSVGKVTVGGTGSVITLHGQLTDGDTGKGTLIINAGGSVTTGDSSGSTDAGMLVGSTADGSGILTVTGAHAVLTNTGLFEIADGGTGVMTIAAGGSVGTSIASSLGQDGADLAIVAGSHGTVTVTGAGSTWSIGSNLVDGGQGTGKLTVASGGSVTIQTTLVVGQASGGHGSLTIESGGVLSAKGEITIGAGTSATGTVLVEGSGSTLDYGAQLVVGNQAAGTLTIDAGATVQALSGGSGEIDIGATTGGKGTLTVIGTLDGTTLNLAQVTGTAAGTAKLALDGGTLALSGTAGVGHGATISLAGGDLQAGQLSFLGGSLSGYGTIAAGVTAALITASGGTLAINGAIGGTTGMLKIAAGATLNLNGSVGVHDHVAFQATTGVLDLSDPSVMQGVIADFVVGNTIDLAGVTSAGYSYNPGKTGGHLTIDQTGGPNIVLAFSGTYSMSSFTVTNMAGGTVITHH